jgi:DNA-binding transcriptional LysR family regulator
LDRIAAAGGDDAKEHDMRRSRTRNGVSLSDREEGDPRPAEGNIPTDLLRTFVAICELGSFTKAAQLFGLTQPAVSAHMRRLETIIGSDLIEKNTSGVKLTVCGSEVLRQARRILAINDQIVSSGGQQPSLPVVRLGIPNLFAQTKLKRIVNECRDKIGKSRLQIRCENSGSLLTSIRNGYLDLAFVLGDDTQLKDARSSWSEPLVWARAPEFVWQSSEPVPLISSPNLLAPDRTAMDVLERAGRRYDIVFTAFDMAARRAAAASALGYLVLMRSMVPPPLVEETPGVLPELPGMKMGIIAREDLDTKALAPLITAFEAVLTSRS